MYDILTVSYQAERKQHKLNDEALYRNVLRSSRFIMQAQTNLTTCLPITDSYACLLITAGFKTMPCSGVTLSLCVGCRCCCAVSNQSRGLIRALVSGLIAIGRDPIGLRAVPCGTPL